jgi:hypothetical protein
LKMGWCILSSRMVLICGFQREHYTSMKYLSPNLYPPVAHVFDLIWKQNEVCPDAIKLSEVMQDKSGHCPLWWLYINEKRGNGV